MAHQAADRRNCIEQGQQLDDIVAVAAGQQDREGYAVPVGDRVALGPRSRRTVLLKSYRGAVGVAGLPGVGLSCWPRGGGRGSEVNSVFELRFPQVEFTAESRSPEAVDVHARGAI